MSKKLTLATSKIFRSKAPVSQRFMGAFAFIFFRLFSKSKLYIHEEIITVD